MIPNIKCRAYWAIGHYEESEIVISYVGDPEFDSPAALLDYLKSDEGKTTNLGPCGLIFLHVTRTKKSCTTLYFHTLAAANRFHKSLKSKQPA